ncbi:MAG: elongation factor Ts [Chromatiaceae bacterium]|jgi:elongation factor Ts|nr:elongation factor Ts [Chromatiaceae bacterium]MBP8197198.1 elongation factor Ts [Chromatiaceae bacterium]
MEITASLVKELRERTGAGMMECKRALVESQGSIEAAIEAMRKSGQAKAAKKAGRIAADGVVVIKVAADGKSGVMVEVNSETDFVAKDANFKDFADAVGEAALAARVADVEALSALPIRAGEATTIAEAREALIAKIGENIQVRRLVRFEDAQGQLHSYRHGVRIGVLVEMAGGDPELGKDIAMHVAASNPLCVDATQVPAGVLEKEKDIFRAQALESGKPAEIMDKIIDGRVRKYMEEITLLGQPFVKDVEVTVEKLLGRAGAKVHRFSRVEVGEGIEKKQENFADEVMAQVRGD